MARAVELCNADRSSEAAVALDLAFSSPLLVIAKQGKPLYARVLRGGGLQSMMRPLEEALHVSEEECHQLLTRYGVVHENDTSASNARATMQLIADPLDCLVNEINRTLGYVRQQFPESPPKCMWLLGGGAGIRNLPEYLSKSVGLPALPWTLNPDRSDTGDASYAIAAALSALSWEDRPCI
jgi:Tfp pilus assembly PilM family ATPase